MVFKRLMLRLHYMRIDEFAFQKWLLKAENEKEDTILQKFGNVAV